ncbi:MAG: multidrug ABC transporter substrate-binding protein [Candidatus Doudnabacteria bacterium CG10_big_fil_rev_8_21_14_0_10_42_18]|uniref:Multidrug ABC transporter substrate-binding protein n=1 Tax=Candidatus Doudnabacteria bacterium CG10_big_fil_rev_8_21_14_0_10_42_18 TaxID=1974552 RepID=A0A2H0VC40_9BACT|nr:MAG: multidrug ABC transporter substrate-binding protein [Candidatus Doudnabacteria bacterium CG10_big_fil_rev_8_21_14_0_10_42_18]
MNFISTIKLVFRTLLARKGRSFLTILGIVIGVAGVITIIALGAGAQELVVGQVTKLGTDLLSVQPGKSDEKGPPSQIFGIVITTLTYEDAQAMRDTSRVPHAVAVNAQVRGQGTVTWQNRELDTYFTGTESNLPEMTTINANSGRFFDERESSGNSNVVVLGSYISEQLFGEAGVDPIGQVIKVKTNNSAGIPLRIIGVAEERGSAFFQNQDDQIYMPLEIAQKQLLGIRHLQMINIKVDAAENLENTRGDIKQLLMERHRIQKEVDADFTVRNLADAVELLSTITDALRLFLTSMAAVALVVGGIGILNIMMVTVAERTREIGLRKAVGATNVAIRNQFLFEAGTLTLLGGIIGIIVGVVISYLVTLLMIKLGYDWAFVVSPLSILLAVGVSILTGVVFGLYPAFKAAKLDPITALRYE